MTLFSLWQSAQLWLFYRQQLRLPLCDAAIHGFQGYVLTRDLRSGYLLQFLRDAVQQDWWPFGFSLLLVPFQLTADWLGASSYDASTLLVTASYGLLPLAILWTARQVDSGTSGLWAGAIAAGMFLLGPLNQLFAILIAREIPGALFLTVTIGLYLRARRRHTLGAYRLAGGSLLAVFFIKYNFGLLAAIPLVLVEFLRLGPDQRAALSQSVLKWMRPSADSRRLQWARVAVIAYAGAVIGWWVLGRNPADVLYPGLVAAPWCLAGSARWRRADISDRIARLGIQGRACLETVVIPLWLWLLLPWHLHSFVDYLHLASRQRGVLEQHSYTGGILVYGETLVHHLMSSPPVAVAVLATLLAAAIGFRHLSRMLRCLIIIVLVQLLLVILHPSQAKDPRFLIAGAPAMLLAAGLVWAQFATWLGRRTPWLKHALLLAVAAITVGVPCGHTGPGPGRPLEDAYLRNTAAPAVRFCLTHTTSIADWRKTTAIIGGFNEVSAALVAWEVQQRVPHAILNLVRLPRWYDHAGATGDAKRRAGNWLLAKGTEQIVAIRLLADCPWRSDRDYLAFNAWQLAAIDSIEADPGWVLVNRTGVAELNLEILVFEPAGQRDAPEMSKSSDGK